MIYTSILSTMSIYFNCKKQTLYYKLHSICELSISMNIIL